MKMSLPKSLFVAGLPFGSAMGLFFMLTTGVVGGLLMGLVSGLLFGTMIWLFASWKKVEEQTEITLSEGEERVHSGGANHFKGAEAVGGRLHLTSTRLYFRSHAFNFQRHEMSLPLEDIAAVEKVATLGLVPNGILIRRRDGLQERFVVQGRTQWMRKLAEALDGTSIVGQDPVRF